MWSHDGSSNYARIAMTRYTKRQGKVWIRVFPDKPISKKPVKPMGKGKSDQITGPSSSNQVAYCMKWMVFLKRLLVGFRLASCLFNQVRQATYSIEVMEWL